MRILILTAITLAVHSTCFSQTIDSCMLVGSFALKKLEMSQQLDSNSLIFPTMRWSLYEQKGLSDTLTIKDGFTFSRSVNCLNFYKQASIGQLMVKQDGILTILVSKGQLYTIPNLKIETLNNDELVVIERFKTRWVRRSFKKY